jgi:hypothetical protein
MSPDSGFVLFQDMTESIKNPNESNYKHEDHTKLETVEYT